MTDFLLLTTGVLLCVLALRHDPERKERKRKAKERL